MVLVMSVVTSLELWAQGVSLGFLRQWVLALWWWCVETPAAELGAQSSRVPLQGDLLLKAVDSKATSRLLLGRQLFGFPYISLNFLHRMVL